MLTVHETQTDEHGYSSHQSTPTEKLIKTHVIQAYKNTI